MHRSPLTLVLLFAACDPGEVVLLSPEKIPSDAPAVSIRVVVDTPFASVATELGWTTGVPNAQVRVHRMEEPYDESYWHVATTDSAGIASFTDLLSGLYEVEVTRRLSGPEMVQADSALHLLAGGRRLHLPSSGTPEVTTAPDHTGSLVFSEFGWPVPLSWETAGTTYPDARYFEVYNNSDTTIYLDGKYWGMAWYFNLDYRYWPCAQTEIVRNDPDGIWTRYVFRFPGRGSDYPLAPGQASLIARAAVDHRPVHAGLYDLRDADFEWGGWRTADNPDVPNLEDIGLQPMAWYWPSDQMPTFLAEPVDLETLPRYVDPYSGSVWVRIPRTLILDTWANVIDWAKQSMKLELRACLQDLHRSFERLAGPAVGPTDFDDGVSYQRRVLTVLPDGRKVLQDTQTSMVDFVKAARTPGWIPDPLGR